MACPLGLFVIHSFDGILFFILNFFSFLKKYFLKFNLDNSNCEFGQQMNVSKFVVVAFALLTALTLHGLSWGDDSASAAEEEELTPCQKMMAKCRGNWGECFPREAYNGDACCQQGASFKCGDDMNIDERISKDPAFAKMMNCLIAGHPNLESLEKCLPDPSECKSPRFCHLFDEKQKEELEKCPRKLKCLQQKHPDWRALRKCLPKNASFDLENCNAPMPPIENTTEA